MNTLSLAALPVFALGLLSVNPNAPVAEDSEPLDGMELPAPPSHAELRQPRCGLAIHSLQPAHGLDSGARGLTPDSEWNAMFPRKTGMAGTTN